MEGIVLILQGVDNRETAMGVDNIGAFPAAKFSILVIFSCLL
jgi:hypothetical protein